MAILALAELSTIWVNDIPVSPMRWDFIDETGNPVAIGEFDTWSVDLYDPSHTVIASMNGVPQGNHLSLTFGAPSLATVAGVYSLQFRFVDGGTITAEPYEFLVQEATGWLTLEQARSQWADAPLDDIFLWQILETAKTQCIAYAPVLPLGASVPLNYVQAQLTQSRALYQSTIANQNDSVGIEGFTVRVFPLDFTIRAMLRPKRAIGGMF